MSEDDKDNSCIQFNSIYKTLKLETRNTQLARVKFKVLSAEQLKIC